MKKILIAATLITCSLAFTGCKLAATAYYEKHPDRLADKCAREYPIKTDSVSHDSTSHTQAITSHTDTAQPQAGAVMSFNCDSAQRAAKAEGYTAGVFSIQCPTCPPSTHTTTTIHDTTDRWHTITVNKENTAEVASVRALLAKSQADNVKVAKQEYLYQRTTYTLLLILLIYVAIRAIKYYLTRK